MGYPAKEEMSQVDEKREQRKPTARQRGDQGDSTSWGRGSIDNTSEGSRFHHLDTDGDSGVDCEPDQEDDDDHSAASNVEEAKAGGLRVALDVLHSHARDGSDPPAWALSALGMSPPSEDALRQVVKVTQAARLPTKQRGGTWFGVRPARWQRSEQHTTS